MLNEHMLVRIGGGWDTLEHYLMTHAPSKEGMETKMIDNNTMLLCVKTGFSINRRGELGGQSPMSACKH